MAAAVKALGVALVASTVGGPAGEELAYPGSFFDFLPGIMFAVGGVAAGRDRRRSVSTTSG